MTKTIKRILKAELWKSGENNILLSLPNNIEIPVGVSDPSDIELYLVITEGNVKVSENSPIKWELSNWKINGICLGTISTLSGDCSLNTPQLVFSSKSVSLARRESLSFEYTLTLEVGNEIFREDPKMTINSGD